MGALGVFTLRQIENLKQALKVSPVMVQIQNTLGWGWESLIAPIITCDGVKCNGSVIEGKTGPTPISPLLTTPNPPLCHMLLLHPNKRAC